MASKKASTKKTTATKAPAKKAAEKAAPAKQPPAKKKAPAAEKKVPATKTAEKKAPAAGKKAPEKKAPAKKAEAPAVEKKVTAKKAEAPAKKAEAPAVEKKAPAKKAAAKKEPAAKPSTTPAAEKKAPAKKSEAPAAAPPPVKRLEIDPEALAKDAAASVVSEEDAKKIQADVLAARKQPKGPCRAALPLRFTNQRKPVRVADLHPNEQRQLVAAGVDGLGVALTPPALLDPRAGDGGFAGTLEVWDVVDAHGIPVYAVWMYLVDNGTVFRAGTIDVVGGVSQGGLECAEEGLEEALLDAKSRVDKKLLQGSDLRSMG